MRIATKKDKELVVDIISESFIDNPSVLSTIKNDHKKQDRIKYLAQYAFNYGLRRQGVYLSDNNKGVAICYLLQSKKESWKDYRDQVLLVIKSIGVFRVLKVAKRDGIIKKARLQDQSALYFWFLGVKNAERGKEAVKDLKNSLLQIAEEKKQTILLETSVLKNKNVYERNSFTTYHSWENDGNILWFMKKESTTP